MTQPPDPEITNQQATQPVRPWASLGFRDFRLLWTANLSNAIGRQMFEVANYFQVYQLTGSPILLGLTGLFQGIPAVVLGLFGGAMADAFDRKNLILITQALTTIPVLAIAILTATGTIQVWHIFLMVFTISSFGVLGRPSRISMIPRMVPRTHLMNAIVLNQIVGEPTRMFGPLIAGILIDWIGLSNTYFVNALIYIPALPLVLSIRTPGLPEGPRQGVSLKSMSEGIRFIWSTRVILALFLLDLGVISVGFYRPLLPILARDVFHMGATGLGALNSAPAVGYFIGSAILLTIGNVQRKGVLVLVATFIFAISLGLLGISSWFVLALSACVLLGLTDAISASTRHTLVQLLVPDYLRGRAASMLSVFSQGANSLGSAEIGLAAAIMGVSGALFLGSGIALVVGVRIAISGTTNKLTPRWFKKRV